MDRSRRIIPGAVVLVLLVAGTAFATNSASHHQPPAPLAASRQPETPDDPNENDGKPLTDDHAAKLVDLLATAGIDGVSGAELKTLAAKYGVGGAVRLESWAKATGKTVDELAAMVDGGQGWGAIANQLQQADSSLNLSPGIGWIMSGGHGHGADNSTRAKDAKPEASSSGD
jgi:hypothetical protein